MGAAKLRMVLQSLFVTRFDAQPTAKKIEVFVRFVQKCEKCLS